jgi:hypothetical protein
VRTAATPPAAADARRESVDGVLGNKAQAVGAVVRTQTR